MLEGFVFMQYARYFVLKLIVNICNVSFQDYDRALTYTNGILKVEPKNHQVQELKKHIEKKLKKGNLMLINKLLIMVNY